jgi:hypothetical protein
MEEVNKMKLYTHMFLALMAKFHHEEQQNSTYWGSYKEMNS